MSDNERRETLEALKIAHEYALAFDMYWKKHAAKAERIIKRLRLTLDDQNSSDKR